MPADPPDLAAPDLAAPDLAAPDLAALDRHALVLAVWTPAGVVASGLFHLGLGGFGAWAVLGGFAAIVAGFGAHVLVNVAHGAGFSARELAVGLVAYLAALVLTALAALGAADLATPVAAAFVAGFLALPAIVVFTMLVAHGPRGAFAQFDVIRSFAARRGRDRAR